MRPFAHVTSALFLATTLLGGLGAIALSTGCHAKQELTAAPPPLRPEPEPAPQTTATTAQKDSDPVDADHQLKEVPYDKRSINEAADLATEGLTKLREAETAETSKATREASFTEAVEKFIDALAADPYNASATYNLAAAYARIGRKQCSLNLLERLIQMHSHPGKKADVEVHLDRLLGRKGGLDPDFSDMRRDDRFRQLISKLCEGGKDGNCVLGH
jgi:tetratricopeptide (TPR) repeat protein